MLLSSCCILLTAVLDIVACAILGISLFHKHRWLWIECWDDWDLSRCASQVNDISWTRVGLQDVHLMTSQLLTI